MSSRVLNDQGTADDLNSNALEIKIASGKVCLVSASKTAILNADGRRQNFSSKQFSLSVLYLGHTKRK